MVESIETELNDNNTRITAAKHEIEIMLDSATAQNRAELTSAEAVRTDALFRDIDRMKSARRRIEARLEKARAIQADERELDRRASESDPGYSKPAGSPSIRQAAADGTMLYGAGSATTPEFTRLSDGRNAAMTKGQRFADHPIVREAITGTAERDRHIIGQHGDVAGLVRSMSTTTGSAIVPTAWSASIIDKARDAAVLMNAGATLVPMDTKTVQIGRLTQDPAPAFKAEGSPVSATDPGFDYVQLTSTSLSTIVVASIEFLQDAPNADAVITDALAKAMALEIDKAGLFGQMITGNEGFNLPAPYPKGILKNLLDNAPGQVLGGTTNGTAQTAATPWNELLALYFQTATQNEKCGAIISNAKLVQQYAQMYDTMYNPVRKPDVLAATPWLVTNAIPSFTSGTMTSRATDVFAGDFSQLLIGQRLGLEIRTLTERYAENGQVGLLAYWRGDIQVARPKALAVYRYLQGA